MGRVPVLMDLWNVAVMAGATLSAQDFNTTVGMSSGPHALEGSWFLSSFVIPH